MASVPLTLDTLPQSPMESPLMSPHKAMSAAISLTGSQANERPSHLTLDGQQHSNVSPSSSSLSAHGNVSPGLSSAGSLSPSFLPEMPQWKRDLIQRRKQNVQRTINASSPNATAAAATSSPLSSPSPSSLAHGLKTSTSSSSMRSLAGSNTNIDQVASDGLQYSPTKDFNKLSSAGAATAKVNKHHATTIATGMPATIKATLTTASPNKEESEKLFGGQYTATATTTAAEAAATATVNTKEEITKDQHHHNHHQQQQQQQQQHHYHYQQHHTMDEEYLEKSKKTKDYHTTTATSSAAIRTIKTQHEEKEQERQEEEEDIRHITTTIKPQQQQHQMATRLTGSSSSSSSSSHTTSSNTVSSTTTTTSAVLNKTTTRESISSPSSSSSFGAEREQQHVGFSITGANSGSSIQSSSKRESERLVCAANIAGSNTTASVKISQKLQQNQFIKNEQQKTKIIKYKSSSSSSANTPTTDLLKSPTKIAATATASFSPSSSSSSISITNNCLINNSYSSHNNIKKMVAMQEMKKSSQNSATSHLHSINSSSCGANGRSNRIGASSQNPNDLDSNEDLSYGPGIVSKLRCRYLSLALRESMEQQRLNKNQLRRSTSLNNLLDDDCVDHGEDDEDNETLGEEEDLGEPQKTSENVIQKKSGILKTSCNSSSTTQEKRFSQGSNGVGVTFTETSFNKRSRHLKRGNDSLKRARSVEALLSEKSPWQPAANRGSAMPTCVTIEDKIHNARERLQQGTDHLPPKRLTSIIDDTERPPPDLVKQTLKMFEASANRRPRCTNRSNSKGDVASKVETFKNIIKEQKPVVTYPKPSSPTKKLNTQPLVKPLKSTTQASDLLQTPLGRKTLAVASSNSSNTLSDHTPDIIPRQKLHSEREMSKEKFTGINKEKFMNSLMEPPLSTSNVVDSPLKSNMKEKFLGIMVDSPVTALTKELGKMKLNDIDDDNAGKRKGDNFARNGGGGGVGGVDGGDDALHDNDQYNSKTEEMNTNEFSSLKSENDKISETTPNSNAVAAAIASPAYEATVKAHTVPGSSDLSDGEDDDEYGISTTKRITRSALDNIAKAGTTQQFKFSTTTSSSHHHSSSSPSSVGGKQIGVIRPLLNTSSTTTTSSSTTTQKLVTESNMETLKQHSSPSSLTTREIEKNRINDLKKSSTSSPSCSPAGPSATSSPSTASLDNVIKSSTAVSAASGGYSDVDTVISATNSPLWAMRKRRQNPPAQPAENTSMVFNFSNRKEVPDYIENDGVIFRRKRELPKPSESGFVLLGDLSVETSTDMDYDDFSMCPPSPCDVEFVNANIVIDGKSSIRQKSKDATFRVQFNDTLTSTFEYPSEASLVVEDSFADYAESEFNQALQNLVLESYASSSSRRVDDDDDSNAIIPSVHHVADEIIQLPTTNESSSSSPANQQTTKNILGNLPLDYPDLGKATTLTVVATNTANSNSITTQENNNNILATQNHFNNNITTNNNNSNTLDNNNSSNNNTHLTALPKPLAVRKSRKDLKLPLLEQLQQPPPPTKLPKPQLPTKRCQMIAQKPLYSEANLNRKVIDSNDLNIPAAPQAEVTVVQQHSEPAPQQQQFKELQAMIEGPNDNYSNVATTTKPDKFSNFALETNHIVSQTRKVSHVLNKPQYACFLQQSSDVKRGMPAFLSPVQRSRSNEFQRTFGGSNFVTTSVFRSSSLRNIDKTRGGTTSFSLSRVNATPTSMLTPTTTSATSVITTLYFTPDVNLTGKLTQPDAATNPAKILCTADAIKSKSLNNLTNDLTGNSIPDCNITAETNVNSHATESYDKEGEYNIYNPKSLTDDNIRERQMSNCSRHVTECSNKFSDNPINLTQDIPKQHYISCSTVDVTDIPPDAVIQQMSYSSANLTDCCNNVLENTTLSLPNLTEISNVIKDEVTNYFTESQLSNVSNDFTDYSVKITEPTTLSLPNLTRTITNADKQKSSLQVSYLNTNLTEYTVNITEQMTLSLPNLSQAPSYSTEELTDQISETCKNNKLSVDLECIDNLTCNPLKMTDKTESLQSVNNSINVDMKQHVRNLNIDHKSTTYGTDIFDTVEGNITEPLHCKTNLTDNVNESVAVNGDITELYPTNFTESLQSLTDLTEHSVNVIHNNGNDNNINETHNSAEVLKPNICHLRKCPTLALQLSVDSLDEYSDSVIETLENEDNDDTSRDLNENTEGAFNQWEFNKKCTEFNKNSGDNVKSSPKNVINDQKVDSFDMVINELPCESRLNSNNTDIYQFHDDTLLPDNEIESISETTNAEFDFSIKSVGSETNTNSLGLKQTQCDSENKKISLDFSNHLGNSNNSENTINANKDKTTKNNNFNTSQETVLNSPDNEREVFKKSKIVHKTETKSNKSKSADLTSKKFIQTTDKSVNLANITLKKVGGIARSSYREKSPEVPTKSSKILQLNPTNRLPHLLETTSKEVATYLYQRANSGEASRKSSIDFDIKPTNVATPSSTFRSGHKCNRNISSSFRQALTMYESFNENSKDADSGEGAPNLGVQRSKSLIENPKNGKPKLSSKNYPTEKCDNISKEANAQESPYYSLSDNSLEYYDTLPIDDNGNANVLIVPVSNYPTKTGDSIALLNKHPTSVDIRPSPLAVFNTSPQPFRKLKVPKEIKDLQESSFLVLRNQNVVSSSSLDVNNYHTTWSNDSGTHPKISPLLPLGFRASPSASPKSTSSKSVSVGCKTTTPPVPQKPTTINPSNAATVTIFKKFALETPVCLVSTSSSSAVTNPTFPKNSTAHEISVVTDSKTSHSISCTPSYMMSSSTGKSSSMYLVTSTPSLVKFSNEFQNDISHSNSLSSETISTFAGISRKPRELNKPQENDLRASWLGYKPNNSNFKSFPFTNSTFPFSPPSFGNNSEKFHVDALNPPDFPINSNVTMSKATSVDSEKATSIAPTSGFKIFPLDPQIISTSSPSAAANDCATPAQREFQTSVLKAPYLESTQTSSKITGLSFDLNSPAAESFVPYSIQKFPGSKPTFTTNSFVNLCASTNSLGSMSSNFATPENQNSTITDNFPHDLRTVSAEPQALHIDSKIPYTTNTVALPTQMGTEHTATLTLHTLPVKVTSSTSLTRKNNNNAFSCATNNDKHQVKGEGGFTSKPVEFLKTTISCSSTFSSTSCSCSSTPYSTITTTSTTTKVHATSKRMPQRDVLHSATPPKVMPRRIFATPLPTAPSLKTKTSKNTAITTGTIKTMTATSITSNSSSSSSPSRTSITNNNLKASSSSYKSSNNNKTTTTASSALCAPPLRRRIPGNTLYYV